MATFQKVGPSISGVLLFPSSLSFESGRVTRRRTRSRVSNAPPQCERTQYWVPEWVGECLVSAREGMGSEVDGRGRKIRSRTALVFVASHHHYGAHTAMARCWSHGPGRV